MAEKKMTKKNWFEEIATLVEGIEIEDAEKKAGMLNFVKHEIELLNKKSTRTASTEVKEAQEKLMETIVVELAKMDKPVTVSEMQKESKILAEYSNQKLSAMLRKLVETEKVVRTIEKKKAYFSVVEATEIVEAEE